MARFCINCSHQLRDDEKFCAQCGTPVGGSSTPAQSVQWENCAIEYSLAGGKKYGWGIFGGNFSFYYGMATGPAGQYPAAKSPEFQGFPGSGDDANALNTLIKVLTADGWELLPYTGEYEWQYRFRRPFDPKRAGSPTDLVDRGKALSEKQQYADALPLFERASRLAYDSFSAWFNLGFTYFALGRWPASLTAYERAQSIEPNNRAVWDIKGLVLEKLKRYPEALAAFERGFDRKSARDWGIKARLLRALNRTAEADEAERQAKKLGGEAP